LSVLLVFASQSEILGLRGHKVAVAYLGRCNDVQLFQLAEVAVSLRGRPPPDSCQLADGNAIIMFFQGSDIKSLCQVCESLETCKLSGLLTGRVETGKKPYRLFVHDELDDIAIRSILCLHIFLLFFMLFYYQLKPIFSCSISGNPTAIKHG